jgi:anti-sigma B factor antagonist
MRVGSKEPKPGDSETAFNKEGRQPKDCPFMTDATIVLADRVERVTRVRTIASDDWRAAIALHGELDVANAHELRDELTKHIEAGRRVIRVDLQRVSFIDSTAIGELIHATQLCSAEHGSLILTNVSAGLYRVLKLTGFDKVLLVDTAGGLGREASA